MGAFLTRHTKTQQPIVVNSRFVGRNDPCPCGSGLKFKKCCLPKTEGFVKMGDNWVSRKYMDAKIAEKTKKIKPLPEGLSMK